MNILKNTYVKCALVLSCICVASAGLIGGLNAVAEYYKETHKSTEAPAHIKALKSGANFVEVENFTPTSFTGNNTKSTITAVYALMEGGKPTGYAYEVNCGKPVKTDVVFSVLFEGPATEATKNSVKPSAINLVEGGMMGGDAGYDVNVAKLGDAIVAGTASMNDESGVVSGGTKSQKFLLDGLQFARTDYVARINGGSVTPVEKTPLEEIYGDNFKSSIEDTTFTKLTGTTDNCSYEITTRYEVTLKNSTVTTAYAGETSFTDPEEGGTNKVAIVAAFSGDKTTVTLDGYKLTKNTGYNDYKTWLEKIKAGTVSFDDESAVETGSTYSTKAVRDMLLAMRQDYIANYKSEIGKLYGADYVSDVADEFTALTATTSHCSYEISKRYTVTLTSGTGKAYEATTSFQDPEGETDVMKFIAAFSGTATDVKLNGYKFTKNISWDDYKGYVDGVKAGTTSLDDEGAVHTGSTLSTNAVRDTLLAMRADYITSLGE